MAKNDYYQTLGVGREATAAEIKKAYKKLAMKHHPDRNQGDKASEKKFKELSEAYEVLSDDNKRQTYNQFGHEGMDSRFGGGGGGGFSGSGSFNDIFGDVFGDIFGGGGGRSQSRRGADLEYQIELSLEEAVNGKEAKMKIPTSINCVDCDATGAKNGTAFSTCAQCGGVGQVRMSQGFFSVQQPCPRCGGRGKSIDEACMTCSGAGKINKTKSLSVNIPSGVDTGDQIRLSGEGEAGGQGAPSGDLYVSVRVKPHSIFQRQQDDLLCEQPISYTTAALGDKVIVPTLNGGKIELKIPNGTQSGKQFRIKGKGVKSVRSNSTGDLYCRVHIETPVNLTKEQKDLLSQLDNSFRKGKSKHIPKEHTWVDKIKDFLG
ncbi:MAG: molecular chaperone DnaJ [Gammaproteobacteria bacterium]|nr:molecular chaperone DnaJ [Gammaproteobacteria bacterium]